MKVQTTKGMLERDLLTAKDIVYESDEGTGRVIATEWYLGDELVRRDAWMNLYRGFETVQ